VVDGTSGDDNMPIGHVDADGDAIDGADGNNDYILAGDGNDSINAGAGDDTIYGGDGDDSIDPWSGDDVVYAGSGNDVASVSTGAQFFDMGTGDDTISVWDNASTNTIFGGDDLDMLDFENWQSSVGVTVTFGGDSLGTFSHYAGATTGTFSEIEAISGTEYADTIDASADSTGVSLSGEEGDDSVTGGSGDDTIDGGEGADILDGGDGADRFTFQDTFGSDTVAGSGLETGTITDGSNTVTFSEIENISTTDFADYVDSRPSGSNLNITAGGGDDTIFGGTGDDTVYGGDGVDRFYGAGGDNTFYGGSGNDRTYFHNVDGHLEFHGGEDVGNTDTDTLDIWHYTSSGFDITFTGDETGTFASTDGIVTGSFTGVEAIQGTILNDAVDVSSSSESISLTTFAGEDSVLGSSSDDTINLREGSDTVDGGAGHDRLDGGEGDDLLDGGTGNDTIIGGTGSDTIVLHDGYFGDNITGGEDVGDGDVDVIDASGVTNDGVDVFLSGSESGSITSSEGTANFVEIESFILTDQGDSFDGDYSTSDLTVEAGAGDDTLTGGSGNNTLLGGEGDDVFHVGYGVDSIQGGDGTDTLSIDDANDVINLTFGGDGQGFFTDDDGDSGTFSEIEVVEGSAGADTIDALADSSGVAQFGRDGDDRLIGGSGADTIEGGLGADTIKGGSGNDSIIGGAGDDIFTYTSGDGADTIRDFNAGNSGTLNDGDNTNNDFIDLSEFYDNINELRADQADDGVLFTGATAENSFFTIENTGVVCYVTGTRILTPKGEVAIETLKPGDKVITRDNGAQLVRWIGVTTVECTEDLAPIRIQAGALGDGSPKRDLFVSPQHRILVRSKIVERMTGKREALIAATKLSSLAGIRKTTHHGLIGYVHLMCDAHEIVCVEGTPSETLLPGPQARTAMGPVAWAEITTIFPKIAGNSQSYPPARKIPSNAQQKNLVRRHKLNETALLENGCPLPIAMAP